jgi:hypothetical protein
MFLQGLGYDGLGRLLGMAQTAGTVPDGLPPPRSALISSCMRLHQPNVSSTLTLPFLFQYCPIQTPYSCNLQNFRQLKFLLPLRWVVLFLYETITVPSSGMKNHGVSIMRIRC